MEQLVDICVYLTSACQKIAEANKNKIIVSKLIMFNQNTLILYFYKNLKIYLNL